MPPSSPYPLLRLAGLEHTPRIGAPASLQAYVLTHLATFEHLWHAIFVASTGLLLLRGFAPPLWRHLRRMRSSGRHLAYPLAAILLPLALAVRVGASQGKASPPLLGDPGVNDPRLGPLTSADAAGLGERIRSVWMEVPPSAAADPRLEGAPAVYVALRAGGKAVRGAWITEGVGLERIRELFERWRRLLGAARAAEVDTIEVVRERGTLRQGRVATGQRLLEPEEIGILGLELVAGDRRARFGPTEMLAQNLDSKAIWARFAQRERLADGDTVEARVFEADQLLMSLARPSADRVVGSDEMDGAPEKTATALMTRGNEIVRLDQVTESNVREFVALASRWLESNLHDDGRMTYAYDPSSSREAQADDNTVRQWMATIALERSAERSTAGRLWHRVEANIDRNLRSFYSEQNGFGAIEYKGVAKLGAMSLAVLAIRHHPSRTRWQHQEGALLRSIDAMWRPDGSFQTFFRPSARRGQENFYPGETLVLWADILEQEPGGELERRFLTSFAHYRAWHLDPKHRNPAFVPWHTQAYYKLWHHRRKPELAQFVFEMNDWLVGVQEWDAASPLPDVQGRFFDRTRPFGPPHASSTAVYLEGLADAYALAGELGDHERAARYHDAIVRGLRSLMQLQFTDAIDMFYVTDPGRVTGGLRTNPYDNRIRCDNVQHALMAAMKVLDRWKSSEYSVARGAPL